MTELEFVTVFNTQYVLKKVKGASNFRNQTKRCTEKRNYTLIANISGMDQAIEKRKTALSTTIFTHLTKTI